MANEHVQHLVGESDGDVSAKQRHLRPIAICVFRREDKLLVFEGYDKIKKDWFFRPLGGAIEFGEHSREAVVREIREELGTEITDLRHLATTENIFTLDGQTGHEIVFVYEADLADSSLYEDESICATEDDGAAIKVLWKPLADFQTGQSRLVPDGLLELLLQSR